MKKSKIVWLLCAMMTFATGCNMINNNPDQPTKPTEPVADDTTPVGAYMTYTFGTNDDLLNMFNVTIEYYDENGKVQSEKIKETAWSKRVDAKSLPAKLGFRILFTLNGNYSISPTKVETISYYYSYLTGPTNAEGKVIIGKGSNDSLNFDQDCASGKLEKWLESYSSHPSHYVFKYDSKGVATSSNWE